MDELSQMVDNKDLSQLVKELDYQINNNGESKGGTIVSNVYSAILDKIGFGCSIEDILKQKEMIEGAGALC